MLGSEYIAQVEERIAREIDSLASGSCKDYSAYEKKVGTIQGLRLAISILRDLVNKTPKEERDL